MNVLGGTTNPMPLIAIGLRKQLMTECKILVKNGARINFLLNKSFVEDVGLQVVLMFFVDAKADFNTRGEDLYGGTLLHFAAAKKDQEGCMLLTAFGIQVDLLDGESNTALHLAITANAPDIALALIEHNCSVNLRDGKGNMPIHLAIEQKQTEVVFALESAGADLNANNLSGQTPISLAILCGLPSVAEFLIERGAGR